MRQRVVLTCAMTEKHECGCGASFDTEDQLRDHVEEHHPDVFEEKFA